MTSVGYKFSEWKSTWCCLPIPPSTGIPLSLTSLPPPCGRHKWMVPNTAWELTAIYAAYPPGNYNWLIVELYKVDGLGAMGIYCRSALRRQHTAIPASVLFKG